MQIQRLKTVVGAGQKKVWTKKGIKFSWGLGIKVNKEIIVWYEISDSAFVSEMEKLNVRLMWVRKS
jgi:hypothetical protein